MAPTHHQLSTIPPFFPSRENRAKRPPRSPRPDKQKSSFKKQLPTNDAVAHSGERDGDTARVVVVVLAAVLVGGVPVVVVEDAAAILWEAVMVYLRQQRRASKKKIICRVGTSAYLVIIKGRIIKWLTEYENRRER